ncbi:hypothetical protein SAMN05444166_5682 [Singulisphaera sp. GP187]|uniref:helix-turn-helix domain-containing protein n=1 Tax=Singulisphaera sp. GP187 TaxID=1882752 RepID=UPI0009273ACE|nr:helix-turn-helix domain-containing protein [Singulisphaera sp. GP187]SIO58447.1 hypothetical protein SAMN05444166_5682 [Singulisphaera sp. GP187]
MTHSVPDRDWFLKRAKEEANTFICVGGLACSLRNVDPSGHTHRSHGKLAFARLIRLQRRNLRLTTVQLAEKADIDLDELVSIETGDDFVPEPRTISQLGKALRLPEQRLMQLSGLTEARDEQFNQAAVRFAASSEPLEKLSSEERKALEEFVRILARA